MYMMCDEKSTESTACNVTSKATKKNICNMSTQNYTTAKK